MTDRITRYEVDGVGPYALRENAIEVAGILQRAVYRNDYALVRTTLVQRADGVQPFEPAPIEVVTDRNDTGFLELAETDAEFRARLVAHLPAACELCGEPAGEGGALCPACAVSR